MILFCERRQKPTYHFISIIITMIYTLKKMSFMDILTCCPLSSNITMGLSSFSWYTAAPHITVLNMTEAPKPQMYILNDFSKVLCFFLQSSNFSMVFRFGVCSYKVGPLPFISRVTTPLVEVISYKPQLSICRAICRGYNSIYKW